MPTSETTVETYTMGTLPGNIFLELQYIFQNWYGDMGATPNNQISQRALQVLADRGFITAEYGYKGHYEGERPSRRALQCLVLEDAHGCQMVEPRNAFEARLVVNPPSWVDAPSGLGVSIRQ